MSIIHFSTELSGGAGAFAKSIHLASLRLGYSSFIITRELSDVPDSLIVKPLTRLERSFRSRKLAFMHKFGLINQKYALFGIESAHIDKIKVINFLKTHTPSLLVFYWVSFFIDLKFIAELRRVYPDIPFVFVCLDEGFLGGGCHFSWGCKGYEKQCMDCPSTSMGSRKKVIQREMQERIDEIRKINPIVCYPTTAMADMGARSASLQDMQFSVLPLGALSREERGQSHSHLKNLSQDRDGKLTILVRSSGEYRKGCDLFVDAIVLLAAMVPDIRSRLQVVSIGDATLVNSKIGEYVDHEFMGVVHREELLETYRNVDALVVTSREDAGPLMINECVALGRYVITTPIGVAPDLIEDKSVGTIVNAFTGQDLCVGIKQFMEFADLNSQRPVFLMDTPQDLTFEGYVEQLIRTAGITPEKSSHACER